MMNERERFHKVFQGQPVDRPPLLDEGVREEVITQWRKEGLPEDQTHLDIFGLKPHEVIGPNLRFRTRYYGRIMDLSENEYRECFNVHLKRFPKDWEDIVRNCQKRDHVVCIWASRGFFQALGVGDWPTLKRVLEGVIKNPDEVKKKLEIYGEFCARMLDMTLKDIEPDFISLGEPISDNNGPLISPRMFDELMIPAYEKIIQMARDRGIKHILVNTYGNSAAVLPSLFKVGMNILWVSEAAETPEMDYLNLRRQFGSELGLIGGIPLSILRSGNRDKMEQKLKEIVEPLMQSGRYIPLASGRVREEIPWSVYKQYREILNEIIKGATHV
jgi:hypothetical protein